MVHHLKKLREITLSDELREPIRNYAEESKPEERSDFVDLANVGLRRGKRIKKPSEHLMENTFKETASLKKLYGLLVMIAELRYSIQDTTVVAYNAFLEGYNDHLDL